MAVCRRCKTVLTAQNSYPSSMHHGNWICKTCQHKQYREYGMRTNFESQIRSRKKYYYAHKSEIMAGKKQWRKEHRELFLSQVRQQLARARTAVFDYYGWKCACCGETRKEFLTIDHIHGGGHRHVKEIKSNLYKWLMRKRFPEGFRTLCYNCNMSRGHRGYCPHERERTIKPFHDRLPLLEVFS